MTLPDLAAQAEVLRALGIDVPDVPTGEGLLVVHPSTMVAADLAVKLQLNGKPGFVVEDMTDLADFVDRPEVDVPSRPFYVASDPQRGDEMANWSPDEAMPAILAADRSPMTIHEGLSWLLQQPETLERNRCFMTIGSRKPKPRGRYDARTPALWISNGTGRDGAANKDAPKLGWCWAGNRHTWLGFGSVASRS